jgi:uncharacterized GH25 family protein
MRHISSFTATAAIVFALTAAASAHDFWIEPSTYSARAGEPIRIHLRVGESFKGDPVARNDARIEEFIALGPSGRRDVIGRDGMDPAGLVRIDEPGVWLIGYRSKPSPLELAAPAFEQYLREEGLERIIDERKTRNESAARGRERFSRSVKSLLHVGSSSASGYDRVLGLTLELVPQADPQSVPGGRLPVRLLHDGKPLQGALVVAIRRTPGVRGEGEVTLRSRTDAEGRIEVPVTSGEWLLKAVHMERAAAATGADWESVWTALTFRVP